LSDFSSRIAVATNPHEKSARAMLLARALLFANAYSNTKFSIFIRIIDLLGLTIEVAWPLARGSTWSK